MCLEIACWKFLRSFLMAKCVFFFLSECKCCATSNWSCWESNEENTAEIFCKSRLQLACRDAFGSWCCLLPAWIQWLLRWCMWAAVASPGPGAAGVMGRGQVGYGHFPLLSALWPAVEREWSPKQILIILDLQSMAWSFFVKLPHEGHGVWRENKEQVLPFREASRLLTRTSHSRKWDLRHCPTALCCVLCHFFGDVLHNHSFSPLQTNLKRMNWRLVKPFSCTHLSCKPVVIGSPSPLEASQGIAAWACVCARVISGGRTVPVSRGPMLCQAVRWAVSALQTQEVSAYLDETFFFCKWSAAMYFAGQVSLVLVGCVQYRLMFLKWVDDSPLAKDSSYSVPLPSGFCLSLWSWVKWHDFDFQQRWSSGFQFSNAACSSSAFLQWLSLRKHRKVFFWSCLSCQSK